MSNPRRSFIVLNRRYAGWETVGEENALDALKRDGGGLHDQVAVFAAEFVAKDMRHSAGPLTALIGQPLTRKGAK